MCYFGIHVRFRNDGSNRETRGESAGLQKQLDKKNRESDETTQTTRGEQQQLSALSI